MKVALYKFVDDKWLFLSKSSTNSNGHCADLITSQTYSSGLYKLHFEVGKYYAGKQTPTLYPFVEVNVDFTFLNIFLK